MKVLFVAFLVFLGAFAAQASDLTRLDPGPDFPYRLQTAIIQAKPDTVIELPEGRFELIDEIVIKNSHLTIRGQGQDKTILSFKNQLNGGQGILATGDTLAFENFAIEDTPGDGLKIEGVNGVTMRGLRIEWTRGPNPMNGSYALYPVLSQNILLEECTIRGASDSGVYVGKSSKIVIRHNLVEQNVGGIELENSREADVYENVSTHNTAGVLVFGLPNLLVEGGGDIRVFNNQIIENNTPNFAPPANLIGMVPSGTGMMIMANRNVEVFGNQISGQNLASVAVVSYLVAQLPIDDKAYDPIPREIYIHDNALEKAKGRHFSFKDQLNVLANTLFFLQGLPIADILYDGIGEVYNGANGLPEDEKICAGNNATTAGSPSHFANVQLANQRWWLPLPGGPVVMDPAANRCVHPSLRAIVLDDPLPVPAQNPPLPPEIVTALCEAPGSGPNWPALLAADCPKLSQYRLFADSSDPTANANGGVPYDLTTPLFSDYATKHRFVFVPPMLKAKYNSDDVLDFPVGTVISKTFGFGKPERIVETRLLVRRLGGWVGLPYVWSGADAQLTVGGSSTQLSFVNDAGTEINTRYPVPNANECASCHARGDSGAMQPIGPKARLLNKNYVYADGTANQLTAWTARGILDGAPTDPSTAPRLPQWDNPNDGTVAQRARAYLEVNCAHCHSAAGLARNTGLWLDAANNDPISMGECKVPVAAGIGAGSNVFDIVPGKPDQSIIPYRLSSTHAKIKMPQLGRSVVHTEGVALVREWIQGLSGKCGKAIIQ